MSFVIERETTPPRSTPKRLFKNIWRQSGRTIYCPDAPRLNGKLALVTGGNGGIGLETTFGLAKRGAEVVILARGLSRAQEAIGNIEAKTGSKVHFVPFDLADLETVIPATEQIVAAFPNRTIDLFVANAGISPDNYSKSSQGYELSFAINVLGHHALIRRLHNQSLFASDSRIVMLTGDIYFRADECTPDYSYAGDKGGEDAYCRSKLGNLWWVKEWASRHKDVVACAVHPGVVDSGLGGEVGSFAAWLKSKLLLSAEGGAQTTLICATQEGMKSGEYYHNTMGHIRLRPDDPGADVSKANALWETLEKITEDYI